MTTLINTNYLQQDNGIKYSYIPMQPISQIYYTTSAGVSSYNWTIPSDAIQIIININEFTNSTGPVFESIYATVGATNVSWNYNESATDGTSTNLATSGYLNNTSSYMQTSGARYLIITKHGSTSSTPSYSVTGLYNLKSYSQRIIHGWATTSGNITNIYHALSTGTFSLYHASVNIVR